MRFWDSGPVISLVDLLYDFARSIWPAWFPHGTLHPDLSQKLDAVLESLRPAPLEAIQGDVGAMRTDLVSLGTLTHESLLGALEGLRTDMQPNTAATREVFDSVNKLRAEVQSGTLVNREILNELRQQTALANAVSDPEGLRKDVRKIQEDVSSLPERISSAFSEVLPGSKDTGKSR